MKTQKENAPKRKTYSMSAEASDMLARAALNMTAELKRTVTRQSILDVVVLDINYKKVRGILAKQNKKNERA